jgi:hypothetical protein
MAGDSNATPFRARTVFQTDRAARTRSPSVPKEGGGIEPRARTGRPRFRDEFRSRPVTFRIGYWLFVVGYWLMHSTSNQLPVTNNQQPITNNQ